jgi:hypothetical protein
MTRSSRRRRNSNQWHRHVRATEVGIALFSKPVKESCNCRFSSLLAAPKQAFAMAIDLINQGHKALFRRPMDLIHPNGCDSGQIHAFPSPRNSHRHGQKHVMPGGFKLPCDFLHAEHLGPFAQIPAIAQGDRTFAATPWNDLDGHTTRGTSQTTHAVEENHRNAPKGNMDKSALRQSIIARTCFATARTDAFAALAGFDRDFYSWGCDPGWMG